MIVRQITDDSDVEQTKALYMSYRRFNKTHFPVTEENFNAWIDRGNKYVEVYGAFVNDELIGTMRCRKWESLPIYNMSSLFTKKGMFAVYNYVDGHPFPYIQDHILEKYEADGYYTWYYHRQIRPAYYRLTKKNKDLLRVCSKGWDETKGQYRYDRFVEEIVKQGTTAQHPNHRAQLRNEVWNNDIMIVKCSLKQEYRPMPNIF